MTWWNDCLEIPLFRVVSQKLKSFFDRISAPMHTTDLNWSFTLFKQPMQQYFLLHSLVKVNFLPKPIKLCKIVQPLWRLIRFDRTVSVHCFHGFIKMLSELLFLCFCPTQNHITFVQNIVERFMQIVKKISREIFFFEPQKCQCVHFWCDIVEKRLIEGFLQCELEKI